MQSAKELRTIGAAIFRNVFSMGPVKHVSAQMKRHKCDKYCVQVTLVKKRYHIGFVLISVDPVGCYREPRGERSGSRPGSRARLSGRFGGSDANSECRSRTQPPSYECRSPIAVRRAGGIVIPPPAPRSKNHPTACTTAPFSLLRAGSSHSVVGLRRGDTPSVASSSKGTDESSSFMSQIDEL